MNEPLASPTETAVKLAKELATKELYILALQAQARGESLEDFIKTIEAVMNKS